MHEKSDISWRSANQSSELERCANCNSGMGAVSVISTMKSRNQPHGSLGLVATSAVLTQAIMLAYCGELADLLPHAKQRSSHWSLIERICARNSTEICISGIRSLTVL